MEEYRQATEDMLGKSKFWGTLSEKIEPEHTFGKKSQLGDVWNAGRCINGDKTTVKKIITTRSRLKKKYYSQKLKSLQSINIIMYMVYEYKKWYTKKNFVSVCDWLTMEMKKMILNCCTLIHVQQEDLMTMILISY